MSPALEFSTINPFEEPVIKRTWNYSILTGVVMLFMFENAVFSKLVAIITIALSCIYVIVFYQHEEEVKNDRVKFFASFVIICVGIIYIIMPNNILYFGLDRIWPIKWFSAKMLTWDYFLWFFASYAIMSICSYFALFLTYFYYEKRRKKKGGGLVQESKNDTVTNIFDSFIEQPTPKNITTLALLLIIAAFVEEIIYRYAVFNLIFLFMQHWEFWGLFISCIVTGLVFGYAHKDNGYFMYVINSTFSGIVFSLMFYNFGLDGAWLIHLFWNMMVVFERKLEIWLNAKGNFTVSKMKKKNNGYIKLG